jgi:hypothetical protein
MMKSIITLNKRSTSKQSYIRSQTTLLSRLLKDTRKKGSKLMMMDCIRLSQLKNFIHAAKSGAAWVLRRNSVLQNPINGFEDMLKKCAKLVKKRNNDER